MDTAPAIEDPTITIQTESDGQIPAKFLALPPRKFGGPRIEDNPNQGNVDNQHFGAAENVPAIEQPNLFVLNEAGERVQVMPLSPPPPLLARYPVAERNQLERSAVDGMMTLSNEVRFVGHNQEAPPAQGQQRQSSLNPSSHQQQENSSDSV